MFLICRANISIENYLNEGIFEEARIMLNIKHLRNILGKASSANAPESEVWKEF